MRLFRPSVLAFAPALVTFAIGACGARGGMDTFEAPRVTGLARSVAGTGGTTASGAAGGAQSAGAPATDAGVDAPLGVDASPDATTALILCPVAPAGDPIELVSYPDSPAGAPRLLVVEPGQPGSPARVAIGTLKEQANVWHPEYRVTRASVGLPWPSGTTLDQPSVVWGVDDHAWGELARGPGGSIALLANYGGELVAPEGLKFRPFDTATWTPGTDVYVAMNGESPYGIALGAGTGELGVGYAGVGYGVAYRSSPTQVGQSQPMAAVLATDGKVLIGPFATAPAAQYPGRAADVTWTGQTYLVTTSNGPCDTVDPLCAPNAVVVLRIRPASGDALDDSGIELVTTIPILASGTTPGRPIVATLDGDTFVAWSEGDAVDKMAPRTVRLARVGPTGELASMPVVLAENAHPTTGLVTSAGALGVLVGWGEAGDTKLPPKTPGSGLLALHHFDPKGAPVQPPLAIPTTQLQAFGRGMVVELTTPPSYLVAWSAESAGDAARPTFVTRLDCVSK